jgi:hypothetical protein
VGDPLFDQLVSRSAGLTKVDLLEEHLPTFFEAARRWFQSPDGSEGRKKQEHDNGKSEGESQVALCLSVSFRRAIACGDNIAPFLKDLFKPEAGPQSDGRSGGSRTR